MIILLIETFSKKDDNLNNIDLLKQRFYKLIYIKMIATIRAATMRMMMIMLMMMAVFKMSFN